MRIRLVGLLFATFASALLPQPAGAVVVGTGEGVSFHQIDFTFASAPLNDSDYGMVIVDFAAVASATGISDGYLNVLTSNGWVVRNVPVWTGAGLPGYGTMFDLGSTGDITSLTALVDVASTPTTSFTGTPSTSFSVSALPYNAEGGESPRTTVPAPMSLGGLLFNLPNVISRFWQSAIGNIEQDTNQCLPAAVANSFQFLEDTYGLQVPHDHKPGIGGGLTNDSLVAELDDDMERDPHGLTFFVKQLRGKVKYLDDNGLGDDLFIKHKNRVGGSKVSNEPVNVGDTTSYPNTDNDSSLEAWICTEIQNGEDVELTVSWDGGGAHGFRVVGAGEVEGEKWISWIHDANQGHNVNGGANDSTAQNGGVGLFDGGFGFSYIVDGKLIAYPFGFSTAATLEYALSESPRPPGTPALPVAGLAALALLLGSAGVWMSRRGVGSGP